MAFFNSLLDKTLKAYRIPHYFAIYEGNHLDHIQGRLENRVLPFFSEHLKFESAAARETAAR